MLFYAMSDDIIIVNGWLLVDRFYTALFSALEQNNCAQDCWLILYSKPKSCRWRELPNIVKQGTVFRSRELHELALSSSFRFFLLFRWESWSPDRANPGGIFLRRDNSWQHFIKWGVPSEFPSRTANPAQKMAFCRGLGDGIQTSVEIVPKC